MTTDDHATDQGPPDLNHHRARLDRAAQHYERFGAIWHDYLDSRPHRLTTTVGPNGRGDLRLVRQDPIPRELALVLGEFLHQLRAALDNCLYAVAVIDSGVSPPPGGARLQWPICLTHAEWKSNSRRYAHLSPDIVDALERIQPYNAESPTWNCLRILHDLARIDRHRTMPVVALYHSHGGLLFDKRLITDIEVRQGIVQEGDVLVRFSYTGAEPLGPEHIDGDFEFDVDLADVVESVGPAGGPPSRPWGLLHSRLRALHDAVVEYTEGLVHIARNRSA